MPVIVPTSDNGATLFKVSLGGNLYGMLTFYSPLAQMWYLNLYDGENNPLALGAAMVPQINILRNFPPLVQTFGQLRIYDNNNEGNTQPDSLGNSATLIYYEPNEHETLYPQYYKVEVKPLPYELSDFYVLEPTNE